MNEKEKLLATFRELGIIFSGDENFSADDNCGIFPKGTIKVTQAYFCFDKNNKFIAVIGDENGSCDWRKE